MTSPGLTTPQGAWSFGNLLVVSRDAVLPPYCVRCGRPATAPFLKKRFSWHPQWLYVFILFALLLYAILAGIMSKGMVLHLPLCSKHREHYNAIKLAALILLLGCIPQMIIVALYFPEKYQGPGIAAGILELLVGLVLLAVNSSMLRATFIDQQYGYFAKAGEPFLRLLPPAPPGVQRPR